MSAVTDEQAIARRLRDAWFGRRPVRVTLTDRCAVQTIVGRVTGVSVTGATATIDGWTVTTADVLEVAAPSRAETEDYAHLMHDLREAASCSFCQGGRVMNAQTWLDGQERPPARCPRCGRVAT